MTVRGSAVRARACLLAGLATVTVLAGCGPEVYNPRAGSTPAPGPSVRFHGVLTAPVPRPTVTLTDTSRTAYDVATRTRDQVTLLIFGATRSSAARTAISTVAQALNRLSAIEAQRVQVLFVTTDPHHDTPTVLRSWLGQFSSRFVGLTGSAPALAAAYHAVGSAGGPPGAVYLFGVGGPARLALLPKAPADDYLADLRLLLAGRTPSPRATGSTGSAQLTGAGGHTGQLTAFTGFITQSAAGAAARLVIYLLNHGSAPDALVAVSSPDARRVVLVQGGRVVPAVDLPPDTPVAVGTVGGPQIVLDPLDRPLRAGATVPVTLVFRTGSRLTLTVPVVGAGGPGSGAG